MKMKVYGLYLLVALLLLSFSVSSSYGASETKKDLKEMLKLLNKHSVKTIQTEYGDVIDCVDIYRQPVFDHPSLKNHTLQMKPSFYSTSTKSKNGTSMRAMPRSWWRSGTCPMGTIPIRRIQNQDLHKATSLENYGRKYPYINHSKRSTTSQKTNKAHTLDMKSNNLYVNCSDVNTSNWWLMFENKEVGYWPGELLVLLKQSANAVQFGGEVYSETIGKEGVPHTSIEMGSGHDARGKFGIAAYIRDIQIIDDSLTEKSPEILDEYTNEPDYYSSYIFVYDTKEPVFYFGGHGRPRKL
ncbi:hypothetical protein MKX03_009120 [Papaver bracteatum]|nr:hypothetical protein MKX03_009120 [Papaver bracteatum]